MWNLLWDMILETISDFESEAIWVKGVGNLSMRKVHSRGVEGN